MASSDDEGEILPQSVMNYHFVDDNHGPITFSVLPIQWGEDEGLNAMDQVFLHGTADTRQKIYKQVIAWKLELSNEQPEVSVLCKGNNWIKLQKPRKSYEDIIRTISITVHFLHFARNNPEASAKTLWDHLRKVFCSYEISPSENDLLDHLAFIRGMVKRDENLAKCKFLVTFLENPRKRKVYDQAMQTGYEAKMSKFIVDAGEYLDEDDGDAALDESDEDEELFDSVCAICDNGGEILCCEGKCLRSFHATKDDGADSYCETLGLSKAQVKAIQKFYCANCRYKQHQCFACGELGSSDKSSGAEVFPCVSATCGHFYHPQCVAKLLNPENEALAEEQQKKIAAGESFTCPVHKCLVCNQGENKQVEELQFAICRRCPRAYHQKCLPRKIRFKDSKEEDIIQRAWNGLIPNHILIYCLKHRIDEDLKTPIRNHIRFPDIAEKKIMRHLVSQSNERKVLVKKKSIVFEDSSREKTATMIEKKMGKMASAIKESDPTKKAGKPLSGQAIEPSNKLKTHDAFKKTLKESVKPVSSKADKSFGATENNASVREARLTSMAPIKGLEMVKSKNVANNKLGKMLPPTSVVKNLRISPPIVDSETEKKIMDLMRISSSSLTLDDIIKKYEVPVTHGYSRNMDKSITQGKVEGSVEAVRAALKKLDDGYNIEDARAVCEPMILNKLIKWKKKLNIYLAPFLHGNRYTSFGRHFTKVDKLKEIVDKLHWYVQNGDMIVDFCCGANDFSRIMKERLEETAKKCAFKNYDLIQPKNDFNFEKRDWMSVRPTELPTGSQLIMGLNPPFGVKASLANKFIDKALEFKPKLLILIVPKETKRLDEKRAPYDLIWEDGNKLSGKSFYLPGSVDVDDKQMEQWNLKPPPLYLWSRSDWTSKHKAIAIKRGHISKGQEEPEYAGISISDFDKNEKDARVSDKWEEDRGLNVDISDILYDLSKQNDLAEGSEEPVSVVPKQKEVSPSKNHDGRVGQNTLEEYGNSDDGCENHEHRKKRASENPKESEHKGKQPRQKTAMPEGRQDSGMAPDKGTSPRINSPPERTVSRSLLEGGSSDPFTHPSVPSVVPEQKEVSPSKNHDGRVGQSTHKEDGNSNDGHENHEHRKKRARENPKEREHKGKQSSHNAPMPEGRQGSGRAQNKGTPPKISSPPVTTVSKSLLEGGSSEPFTHPTERESSEISFRQFLPDLTVPSVVLEQKEVSPCKNHDGLVRKSKHKEDGNNDDGHANHEHRKKRAQENPKEREEKGQQPGHKIALPEGGQDSGIAQDKGTPPRISSPPDRMVSRNLLEGGSSEPFKDPSEKESSEMSFRQFLLDLPVPGSEFGTGYGEALTSIPDEDLDSITRRYTLSQEDPDDITRRYTLNKEDPFASGSTSRNIGTDYRVPHEEEQFPGLIKDNNASDSSGHSSGHGPYLDDLEKFGKREADIRQQLRLYGRQDSDELSNRNPYQLGQDPGFGNRDLLLSSKELPIRNPYQLDQVSGFGNRGSLSSNDLAIRNPYQLDQVSGFSSRGYLSSSPFGLSGSSAESSRLNYSTPSPLGFAPRPQELPPSQQHSSFGWLDE
ncbi:protein ENHANCED DOWNY MILDEW 2-like isoform X2 [Tasmannia lanceolata]|uniref:protein ENHANCED DOWNY MILDEW 2-like isoform X2 n=1 Tax=Tasmannia lanceolata TaxID=3420 RepID=UPI004062FCA5